MYAILGARARGQIVRIALVRDPQERALVQCVAARRHGEPRRDGTHERVRLVYEDGVAGTRHDREVRVRVEHGEVFQVHARVPPVALAADEQHGRLQERERVLHR